MESVEQQVIAQEQNHFGMRLALDRI